MSAARLGAWSACVSLLLATALPVAVNVQAPQPAPTARQVPGINAKDRFPGGCVDCHVAPSPPNADRRLSTQMARLAQKVGPGLLAMAQAASPAGLTLKGRHPPVSAAMLKDIPNRCSPCHARTSKTAPPFGTLLHAIHLTGPQNPFMTTFQGECTHCHKLDVKTGAWSMPSGPER